MNYFYSVRLNKPMSRGSIRGMYGHRVDNWTDDDFKSRGFMPAERTPMNVNRFLLRKSEKEVSWEEFDGVYKQVWDYEDCSEDWVVSENAARIVADEVERRLAEIEGLRNAFPDSAEIQSYIDSLKDLITQPPQELAWSVEQGTYRGWPIKPSARSVTKGNLE